MGLENSLADRKFLRVARKCGNCKRIGKPTARQRDRMKHYNYNSKVINFIIYSCILVKIFLLLVSGKIISSCIVSFYFLSSFPSIAFS